jgi:hypothetical protein
LNPLARVTEERKKNLLLLRAQNSDEEALNLLVRGGTRSAPLEWAQDRYFGVRELGLQVRSEPAKLQLSYSFA